MPLSNISSDDLNKEYIKHDVSAEIAEAIGETQEAVKANYIETVSNLDATQLATIIQANYQYPDGSWKSWSEVKTSIDYGYVVVVQAAMQLSGDYTGAINGNYDQATKDAVKAFEGSHGLAVDAGRVGPQVFEKRTEEYCCEDVFVGPPRPVMPTYGEMTRETDLIADPPVLSAGKGVNAVHRRDDGGFDVVIPQGDSTNTRVVYLDESGTKLVDAEGIEDLEFTLDDQGAIAVVDVAPEVVSSLTLADILDDARLLFGYKADILVPENTFTNRYLNGTGVGHALFRIFNMGRADSTISGYLNKLYTLDDAGTDALVYTYALYKAMDGGGTWEDVINVSLGHARTNGVLDQVYDTFGLQQKGGEQHDLLYRLADELDSGSDREDLQGYLKDFVAAGKHAEVKQLLLSRKHNSATSGLRNDTAFMTTLGLVYNNNGGRAEREEIGGVYASR